MKGSETFLLPFMEGAQKYFIIPVYQRKYDWKIDNCRQLYEDLKRMLREQRPTHFFGSIVSSVVGNGSKVEYHVIDGQQRLTTVALLLLAMRNLVSKGVLTSKRNMALDEEINDRFLTSRWAPDEDKIRLRPVKADRDAFQRLFGDTEDYDPSSNLTHNYQFFCDLLLRQEISVDELFDALGHLQVISITLESGDNAQLIFESLNSTGLALSEGDKIRNYVLMGQPPQAQNQLYENYWSKIEACTGNDVSSFVRDYLSIQQQATPAIHAVYRAFKDYAAEAIHQIEPFLADMLRYARLYEKLRTCKSDLGSRELDACLYRMSRLEIAVTRPFLMEVLRLNQDGQLTVDDVLQVFLMTENYLFRRNICEVPTNALNKIFLTLNKDILRYDGTAEHYVDKMAYTLLAKRDSGRFPDDEEFCQALASKQVYQMRGKYKAYLFERFENYGTSETKDVYQNLDDNTYTIEHIMPQHLTPQWVRDLGPDYANIHATWLHRLANLTLSAYNPSLSNNTFAEKRDAKPGGYRDSGLRMNQKLATATHWGAAELQQRSDEMVERARQIWAYPVTTFQPVQRQLESCTLDDEDADPTGRDIQRYSYAGAEQPVASWAEMFERVVRFLHNQDKSVLYSLADSGSDAGLSSYVAAAPEDLRSALPVDERLYIEKNTSTAAKLNILRRLFPLYQADAGDLVFYLRDAATDKAAENTRLETRQKYWAYALPIIQRQNQHWGIFSGSHPRTTYWMSGFFGIKGCRIDCVAKYGQASVIFWLGNADAAKNKELFDRLFAHKNEIEQQLGCTLEWERANDGKASWVTCSMPGVSIGNEEDWPVMAKFHAQWSDRLCRVLLPYIENQMDVSIRRMDIAGLLREWCGSREGVHLHRDKSGVLYTRFTTDYMSELLPDLPDAPSGWGTPNHYFYEMANRDGKEIVIQLAFGSWNMTDAQRAQCERINQFYPSRVQRENWQWRIPFKTKAVPVPDPLDRDALFANLDQCLQEVWAFETDLKEKLSAVSDA